MAGYTLAVFTGRVHCRRSTLSVNTARKRVGLVRTEPVAGSLKAKFRYALLLANPASEPARELVR